MLLLVVVFLQTRPVGKGNWYQLEGEEVYEDDVIPNDPVLDAAYEEDDREVITGEREDNRNAHGDRNAHGPNAGDEGYYEGEEEQINDNKKPVSAKEIWTLLFTGNAEIEKSGGVDRQICIGHLIILDSEGNKVGAINPEGDEIFEFEAISGPQGNGLLPNGLYKVTKPLMPGLFSDEKGLSFKMPVEPKGELKQGFTRYALLIHPTMHYHSSTLNGIKQYTTVRTEGCIGLVGHDNAAPFLEKMKEYFKTHSFIELNVEITGNLNIKIQLNGKPLPAN